MGCINDCRDKVFIWWGLNYQGTCVEITEGEFTCECAEDYRNKNVLDQPACESAVVTRWVYIFIICAGVCSILQSVYMQRRQQNLLSNAGVTVEKYSLQDRMRGRLHMYGIVWGVVVSVHYRLVLCGVLTFSQSLLIYGFDYILVSELGLCSCEVWLSLLPRALIRRDSWGYRMCSTIENGGHLWEFSIPLIIAYIVGSFIGFFYDPVAARYILQCAAYGQCIYTLVIIDISAYSLIGVIKSAQSRLSMSTSNSTVPQSPYDEVITSIRYMTIGVSLLQILFIVFICVGVLTRAGQRSPLLSFVFLHACAPSFWLILNIHALALKTPKTQTTNKTPVDGSASASVPKITSQTGGNGSKGGVSASISTIFANIKHTRGTSIATSLGNSTDSLVEKIKNSQSLPVNGAPDVNKTEKNPRKSPSWVGLGSPREESTQEDNVPVNINNNNLLAGPDHILGKVKLKNSLSIVLSSVRTGVSIVPGEDDIV